MSVQQALSHLRLSNVNKMYDNPGEYIIRIGIIYFVQQEMHAQFS